MKILDIQPYDNFDVKFRLVICKTRKEMVRARKKYTPESTDTEETTAVFSPMPYHVNDDINALPGSFKSNVFGTLFMNLDDLRKYGDKVIAHECGHAAFAFHHQIRRYKGDFTDNYDKGEFEANGEGNEQEVFCYFLENAFEKVKQAISKYRNEKK
jgi:hypothetical protein